MKKKDRHIDLKPFGIDATIPVISDAKAEEVDYVVCMPKGSTSFTDNFTGNCCICGIEIMYRWHAPRRPRKICINCAAKQASDEQIKKQT